jgi:hypothetical protein
MTSQLSNGRVGRCSGFGDSQGKWAKREGCEDILEGLAAISKSLHAG